MKNYKNLNEKNIEISVNNKIYERHTIHTHFVTIGENYLELIEDYVFPIYEKGEILSISEKIIALCQQRVVYKNDLQIGFWAKFLSKFASTNNYGVGVSNQLKMAYCIKKVGLIKTIYASVLAGIGKIFKKRGIFYKIVGQEVSGLDGFYDNVFKEYGEFGIENPIEPFEVCNEIEGNFGIPCMIVDANDLGQEILGYSKKLKQQFTEVEMKNLIKDNPAGQGNKCTPFVLIREKDNT